MHRIWRAWLLGLVLTAAACAGAASSGGHAGRRESSGGELDPPAGMSSGGSGGGAASGSSVKTASGVLYSLIAPAASRAKLPCMLAYSGADGARSMTSALLDLADESGIRGYVIAVLDGSRYNHIGVTD